MNLPEGFGQTPRWEVYPVDEPVTIRDRVAIAVMAALYAHGLTGRGSAFTAYEAADLLMAERAERAEKLAVRQPAGEARP